MTEPDLTALPADLPVPVDDGAADHLTGMALPALEFATTDGGRTGLGALGTGRTVLYLYPLSGRPGTALPSGWDTIPGARGCTSEACGFRDHHADLAAAGAARVLGLSSQQTDHQRELAGRLRLPYPLLSDPDFALADALHLPAFEAGGRRLYKRITLILLDGVIEHVFYPVFPPNTHAQQVLSWFESACC